jgi:hypothetical protein
LRGDFETCRQTIGKRDPLYNVHPLMVATVPVISKVKDARNYLSRPKVM